MSSEFINHLQDELSSLKNAGLYKSERIISSPQSSKICVNEKNVLNFCSNNYLDLANNAEILNAAAEGLKNYGYGVASVRCICGTQTVHKKLEKKLSGFLGFEDTILYSSCYDANGGLFEALFTKEDALISDALNHASIIDGVRLCKAQRYRYQNNDMHSLEECLKQAQDCRFKLICTDGVFSMDGILANLQAICDLAEKYDAMVMVDDSHAVGCLGEHGRGTPEYFDVIDRITMVTGTLGKALGGASGGYVSSSKIIVDRLRQVSRPYLFSNSLAPSITAASIKALEIIEKSSSLTKELTKKMVNFRTGLTKLGFQLAGNDHPIIPVMLGDAVLAQKMAEELLKHGIYVIGFSYPVVPKNQARIRTQISLSHSDDDIEKALNAFGIVGRNLGIIK